MGRMLSVGFSPRQIEVSDSNGEGADTVVLKDYRQVCEDTWIPTENRAAEPSVDAAHFQQS